MSTSPSLTRCPFGFGDEALSMRTLPDRSEREVESLKSRHVRVSSIALIIAPGVPLKAKTSGSLEIGRHAWVCADVNLMVSSLILPGCQSSSFATAD